MNRLHQWGGYAGLIPFVALALLSLAGQPAEGPLLAYAALIFSFLGGSIWFATLFNPLPAHVQLTALGAMLFAWMWLLLPVGIWLPIAALSFILLYAYERRFLGAFLPQGYARLRLHLSLGAALSLLLATLAP